MFSIIDRKNADRTSSGVSLDNLADKSFLSGLHGMGYTLSLLLPYQNGGQTRRDSDTYFLSSFLILRASF